MRVRTVGAAVLTAAALSLVASASASAQSIKMSGTCPAAPNKGSAPKGTQVITCNLKGGALKKATFVTTAKLTGSTSVGTCTLKGGGKSVAGTFRASVRVDVGAGLVTSKGSCTFSGGKGSVSVTTKSPLDGSASKVTLTGSVK